MILSAKKVSKSYLQSSGEPVEVLKNVNLEVAPGEKIALMGPSGAGKSTLLSILAGLEAPDSGEVFLQKENLYHLSAEKRLSVRAQNLSMIFQNFHLIPFLTAFENVRLPLDIQNRTNQTAEIVNARIEEVGLSHRSSHYPHQMSRGEGQRVAIARALVLNTPLIMADEPTGSLDEANAKEVMNLLLRAIDSRPESSLLLVTHDPNLARLCPTRYLLKDGQLHELV